MKQYINIITFAIIFILISGCVQDKDKLKPKTKAKKGALLGALVGGALGLISDSKNRGKNMLIGGVLGSAIGGTIGYTMKEQATSVASAFGTKVNNNPNAVKDINQKLIISHTDKYVKIMFRDSRMFKTNQSTPTDLARQNISTLLPVLKKYPSTIVEIVGHTDNRGTYKYNLQLSTNRAYSAENIIKSDATIKNRILSKGCSYSKPIVQNTSSANMALNRRVELYLYQNTDISDPCI